MEWITILTACIALGSFILLRKSIAKANLRLEDIENILMVRSIMASSNDPKVRAENSTTENVNRISDRFLDNLHGEAKAPLQRKKAGRPKLQKENNRAHSEKKSETPAQKAVGGILKKKIQRTEEQKRLASERKKAWWAARKAEKEANLQQTTLR